MNSNALLRNDALRDQARTERANVLPCSHSMIETYVLDTGEPAGLWACRACKTKFVPITELIDAERRATKGES